MMVMKDHHRNDRHAHDQTLIRCHHFEVLQSRLYCHLMKEILHNLTGHQHFHHQYHFLIAPMMVMKDHHRNDRCVHDQSLIRCHYCKVLQSRLYCHLMKEILQNLTFQTNFQRHHQCHFPICSMMVMKYHHPSDRHVHDPILVRKVQ